MTIDTANIKALIFDVDGTLYRQNWVRFVTLWRILRAHARSPVQGLLVLRVLMAYRKAQEILRMFPAYPEDFVEAQIQITSASSNVRPEFVKSCVARWMQEEPLEYLSHSVYRGLFEFLQKAKLRKLRLGVFSDYPAVAKLKAMGIAHFFDAVISAQDLEVRKFKPDPRGLEVTLGRLKVGRQQALYIGDRPEIDAVAAENAGIACVIIGRRNAMSDKRWIGFLTYKELSDVIC